MKNRSPRFENPTSFGLFSRRPCPHEYILFQACHVTTNTVGHGRNVLVDEEARRITAGRVSQAKAVAAFNQLIEFERQEWIIDNDNGYDRRR